MEACPLEGLVRSVYFPQETSADFSCTSNTHATSATSSIIMPSFTDALNRRSKAEMTFKIMSELGIRTPGSALDILSHDRPAARATWAINLAQAISPNAFAMKAASPFDS